jgi:hypothetical protein
MTTIRTITNSYHSFAWNMNFILRCSIAAGAAIISSPQKEIYA